MTAIDTPPTPSADAAGPPEDQKDWTLDKPVFLTAAAITLAVTVWCVAWPDHAYSTLESVVGWVSTWFGWYYVALTTSVLLFVLGLGFSRFGRVRLGPEHSRPEFSTGAWAAMLFAAGIGTDLIFYAVYEPAFQYLNPPAIEGGTTEAAREGTVWTLFHYGLSGWGMYSLMGMALAYFAYRQGLPLAVRSALYPIFGTKVNGPIGTTADTAAILGTIFGVATSLGIGVVSLNVGLEIVFGLSVGLPVQIGLVVLAIAIATLSAVTGVDRGIKLISQFNVLLAIVLAAYVLVTGRTAHLLNSLVQNVGDYVTMFPGMTNRTFAYTDTGDWMSYWTLFFWAWWIAWAAFVGMFLARISRGRTIRQFVAGAMIIPFSYIVMWIGIFGNAALDELRSGNTDLADVVNDASGPDTALWSLLQQYPGFTFVAGAFILIGLLFYVTSADSGALVMANLSSRLKSANHDAGPSLRIFWAVATGALTLAILAAGNIYALQYATVIIGLPFAFVMIGVMWGLWKALSAEGHLADSRRGAMPGVLSGRSTPSERERGSWQSRLRRSMDFPDQRRADTYLSETAVPALEDVAGELREQGVEVVVESVVAEPEPGTESADEGVAEPAVVLRAGVGERPFVYRLQRTRAATPSYGGRMSRGDDWYFRLEVHLREGGQGYDVMGYSRVQLIDDVLDQYERHLEFLRLGGSTV
ncbi:choline BCCT transporter BetT [Nocardioides bruguierae]|uniref:Choline BCCT transporter BetT n=1 Tax=Nocardioides bruguierae TaxID=2945102 RepID=A0A9X2D8R4_9ACTN|nr:choline BCCT transporter BetT [Nocardioides bruguierae]MCM0621230.1 choline BCCT transporter BetT [Nocardioides bruguierae]